MLLLFCIFLDLVFFLFNHGVWWHVNDLALHWISLKTVHSSFQIDFAWFIELFGLLGVQNVVGDLFLVLLSKCKAVTFCLFCLLLVSLYFDISLPVSHCFLGRLSVFLRLILDLESDGLYVTLLLRLCLVYDDMVLSVSHLLRSLLSALGRLVWCSYLYHLYFIYTLSGLRWLIRRHRLLLFLILLHTWFKYFYFISQI